MKIDIDDIEISIEIEKRTKKSKENLEDDRYERITIE